MIVFTKHVLVRMKQRKISKQIVYLAIKYPDKTDFIGDNILAYFKGLNYNKTVKIIAKKRNTKIIIITAYYL